MKAINKVLAFMAVMIMLAAPMSVVVACDYESEADDDSIDVSPTHIKLTDIDWDDLQRLIDFGSSSNKGGSSSFMEYIPKVVAALCVPGLNIEGLSGLDETAKITIDMDMQFDFIRVVKDGKETTAVAVSVDIHDFKLTFNTYDGMYMLASEAMTAWNVYGVESLPDEYVSEKIAEYEKDLDEVKDNIDEVLAIKPATGTLPAEIIEALENDYLTMGEFIDQYFFDETTYRTLPVPFAGDPVMEQSDRAEFLAAELALDAAIAAYYDAVEGGEKGTEEAAAAVEAEKVLIQLFSDWFAVTTNEYKVYLYVYSRDILPNTYSTSVMISSYVQEIIGNGDYADGIREAYSGKMFNGEKLVLTGSSHLKFYIESRLVTQQITAYDNSDELLDALYKDGAKFYAISETGLNIGTIMSLLPIRVLMTDSLRPLEIALIAKGLPINELVFDLGLNTNVGYNNQVVSFSTDVDANVVCDLRYDYNDIGALFNNSKDHGYKLQVKELDASAVLGSAITVDGKTYKNAGIDLIDSRDVNELKDVINGLRGDVYYNTPSVTYQPSKTSDPITVGIYWSPYAFIVDPTYSVVIGEGEYVVGELLFPDLFYNTTLTYDKVLKVFGLFNKEWIRNSDAETSEQDAIKLIKELGGECSHEKDVTLKGMNDIYDSMEPVKEKKDNTMTFLWVAIVLIVIFAIIGFGAIMYKRKSKA